MDAKKSNLMQLAHDMTKAWIADHPNDDYRACFAAALKEAHRVHSRCADLERRLTEAGIEVIYTDGIVIEFSACGIVSNSEASSVTVNLDLDWACVDYQGHFWGRTSDWFTGERGGHVGFWGRWSEEEYHIMDFRLMLSRLYSFGVRLPCMRFVSYLCPEYYAA